VLEETEVNRAEKMSAQSMMTWENGVRGWWIRPKGRRGARIRCRWGEGRGRGGRFNLACIVQQTMYRTTNGEQEIRSILLADFLLK
jgi:hypothetical protein